MHVGVRRRLADQAAGGGALLYETGQVGVGAWQTQAQTTHEQTCKHFSRCQEQSNETVQGQRMRSGLTGKGLAAAGDFEVTPGVTPGALQEDRGPFCGPGWVFETMHTNFGYLGDEPQFGTKVKRTCWRRR